MQCSKRIILLLLRGLVMIKKHCNFVVKETEESQRDGKLVVTTHKRSLGQGNIFTPVCHSVHRGGLLRGVCLLRGGGACLGCA